MTRDDSPRSEQPAAGSEGVPPPADTPLPPVLDGPTGVPSPPPEAPEAARHDGAPGVPPAGATSTRVFDVAVVGAGIGGLAVAALMARAGRSVILLERGAEVGGVCRPIARDGYRFDVGATLLTDGGPQGALAILLARLGIDLPRAACDPTVQTALPRHRLTFSRDPERWWPEIRREVPDDEPGWRSLLAELAAVAADRDGLVGELPSQPPEGWRARLRLGQRLARQYLSPVTRRAMRRLRQAEETPLRATLAGVGLGAVSQQALEACLWYFALRSADECSTLEAALALRHLSKGAMELAGGPMALVSSLAECLRRDGGEVRLLTEVTGCLVERGRVCGVLTRDKETIHAGFVVTDVPPAILARGLLPEHRSWLSRRLPIEGPWQSYAVAQILLLVVPDSYLPSELGSHCLVVRDPGMPAVGENLAFVRLGADRTAGQDPKGMRCLSVGRFAPQTTTPDAESLTQALMEDADQVVPGIGGAAVYREVFQPQVLGEIWGRPLATMRYAPDSRQWLGRRGLPHQTGWPELLAIGEGMHPGRLISNVVEGAIEVADRIVMGV
jgi:phytoene dehydrogenase-like protein